MLVISSGAPKSGSTWLFNILSEMKNYSAPPREFLLDEENVNPEIKYDRLGSLLKELDYSNTDYLIKNHFGRAEERDLLLSSPNVFVLDITRDLKDVIVSAYHYRQHRAADFNAKFKHFYWVKGRYVADMVRSYHETWNGANGANVFVASYERLKSDFETEVGRMGKFLRLELSPDDIARIKETRPWVASERSTKTTAKRSSFARES